MRPLLTYRSPQWTFVASGTNDGTHRILNVATQSLRNPRYLTIILNNDSTLNALAVTDEDTPKTWAVKEADRKGVFRSRFDQPHCLDGIADSS